MITLVEGPDCSGKTTLIKNAFDTPYVRHFGKPNGPDGAWREYTQALTDEDKIIQGWIDDETEMAATYGKWPDHWNIVYDRFIYGELIYPEVMKRPSNFTRVHARMLERVMFTMRPVIVFCRTDYDLSHALWRERQASEMIHQEERFKLAYDLWGKLFTDHFPSLPVVFYDMQKDQYPDVIQQVAKKRPAKNQGPGIGNFKPRNILIVGEQVNTNVDINNWTFVDYSKHGASYWLTSLLDDFGLGEDQLYWINALDREGRETKADFIEKLQPRLIITMGKTAEVWANRNHKFIKCPTRRLQHPAYHKRFKAAEPYELTRVLQHDREAQEIPSV